MKLFISHALNKSTALPMICFPYGFYGVYAYSGRTENAQYYKNIPKIQDHLSINNGTIWELKSNDFNLDISVYKNHEVLDHNKFNTMFKDMLISFCEENFAFEQNLDCNMRPFTELNAQDALELGIVLAGSAFKLQNNVFSINWVSEKIGKDESDYFASINRLQDHPIYPTYAIACQTFKIDQLNIMPFMFFNKYGEHVGSSSENTELLGEFDLVMKTIDDLGLSPSIDEWTNEYHAKVSTDGLA